MATIKFIIEKMTERQTKIILIEEVFQKVRRMQREMEMEIISKLRTLPDSDKDTFVLARDITFPIMKAWFAHVELPTLTEEFYDRCVEEDVIAGAAVCDLYELAHGIWHYYYDHEKPEVLN